MISSSMLYMAAGLVTLSVTSAQSGFDIGRVAAEPISVPRWLPYAVLAVLAVGSTVVGIMYPEAVGANLD
jgi:hypothetical protein